MIEAEEHPVQGDEDALASLRELANSLDTSALTAHTHSRGIFPPDGRSDWLIVIEYAEDGTDRGLFWVGPDDL